MSSTTSIANVDISSAEEQQQSQRKVRRKTNSYFGNKRSQPPTAPPGFDALQYSTLPSIPQLHSFSELTQQHPNKTVSNNAAAAATNDDDADVDFPSLSQHTEVQLVQKHKDAAQVDPWSVRLLHERLAALPDVTYYPRDMTVQKSIEELQLAMRLSQLRLPLVPAWHEQELLQEAGRFTHSYASAEDGTPVEAEFDFPSCTSGAKCCGMTLYHKFLDSKDTESGFILTSFMYPAEYYLFLRERKLPASPKPCVLCCRKMLVDCVVPSAQSIAILLIFARRNQFRRGQTTHLPAVPQHR